VTLLWFLPEVPLRDQHTTLPSGRDLSLWLAQHCIGRANPPAPASAFWLTLCAASHSLSAGTASKCTLGSTSVQFSLG
jgi:hypothetical protein